MNRLPNHSAIAAFRKTVYGHFEKHGRKLPWRQDHDPYRIFVSEVMLQQTQVDRVAAKFEPFVAAFPDFRTLASAPFSNVLRLWQGLGYNRRALYLQRAAEIIMSRHNGQLPSSPDELVELPGIGSATAASICAFAFNKPSLFLETNIRSVLIHHFFRGRTPVRDDQLLPVAEAVLDNKNPAKWYSAIMDYGAMLKKRHGNASRRSAHYARQSKFQGSRRQVRGNILKLLLKRRHGATEEIAEAIGVHEKLCKNVLEELCREKIVARRNDRFFIAP